ncbi:ALTO [Betapolyomavirus lepweddellii]|uniref:ALTO n=1 Tax=Betapolyomavirus lepweddellii TaxID=1925019 RepID=A0A1L4AB48_9POLY|nr:ALTO [Betapolyomavirus lepweddellii]API65514.1 ALTO [Betapolyomavirus lepweddellii]
MEHLTGINGGMPSIKIGAVRRTCIVMRHWIPQMMRVHKTHKRAHHQRRRGNSISRKVL